MTTRHGLIVNADDWGADRITTDAILDCHLRGTVSSASAMVFMSDSERAAALAQKHGLETGLHLNFTTPFTGAATDRMMASQQAVAGYLRRHRLARYVVNPRLASAFDYLTRGQIDEYARLYGRLPARVDGHHHMHLCANMRRQQLIPAGTVVRRNFTFQPGEKSSLNRLYRARIDRTLARRHRLTDYLFNIQPLGNRSRLERIVALTSAAIVELETHPVVADEYAFLRREETGRWFAAAGIVPPSRLFDASPRG
jgi:predicted glycoside hydrolase/deacetylase ChbG (UPF0249 family)